MTKIICYFCLLFVLANIQPAVASDTKNVLILYSFNDELPWQKNLRKGLYSRLNELGNNATLFEERLDSARFNIENSKQSWFDYLQKKYTNKTLDLIIVESTAAAEFLVDRPELFPGIKRYLFNVGATQPGRANEVIVKVHDDLEQNFQVALDLSPQAKQVVFVNNLEPTISDLADKIWKRNFKGRVSLEIWDEDFSFKELYQRGSELPDDAIIIFSPVNHDRTGVNKVPYEVLKTLVERASVPVFTTHDTLLGTGAIGGYLMSSELIGKVMAELISGITPDSITNEAFFANMFDSRALQRWQISEATFPVGSEINFQSPTFFEQNRALVVYGLPLLLIETFILFALVRALRSRRLALNALDEEHQLLEKKVVDRTEALTHREAQYRGLFENSSDAILLFKGNDFFDCNRAFLTLFDCSRQSLINTMPLVTLSPPQQGDGRLSQEVFEELLAEARKRGHVFFEWYFWRYSDKSEFIADVLFNTVNLDEHQLIQVVIRDVTERKQFEDSLQIEKELAEQANQAKSDFLSSISHELRTPLNAILGFSQLLEREELTELQLSNISEISKAGDHLLGLINEILDLAKIEAGHINLELMSVKVDEVIVDCLSLVKTEASKQQVSLVFDQKLGLLAYVDHSRLKQVILNLLSNAIKYNRSGGMVMVDSQLYNDETVRITVTDTGRGIPAERLSELFKPFTRVSDDKNIIEGTGIGLTLTQRIAELMGGKVGVDSELGIGSSFWVDIPLETSILPKFENDVLRLNNSAAERLHHPMGQKTILYIDDSLVNHKLISSELSSIKDIHLVTTDNGVHGIELAQRYQPDLILLDFTMQGLDGYQVLEKLKEEAHLKAIPVFAITAKAMPEDIDKGKQAGFNEYITKPLNVEQFLRLVNHYL